MRPHMPTLLRELSRGRPLPVAVARASEPAPPPPVTVRATARPGELSVAFDGRTFTVHIPTLSPALDAALGGILGRGPRTVAPDTFAALERAVSRGGR